MLRALWTCPTQAPQRLKISTVVPVGVGYYLALLILNSIAFPDRFFNFLALPSATMT